jgi:3'(2'), 5'-bisphosphate nucleotidase
MPPDAADDHVLAARLAAEAGELLVDLRARLSADGLDGKPLGAEGDRAAHELLMNRLASARPGDAVLSEEGVADPARLDAERVWIVDPLDGTREFSEVGRLDWAVHVALAIGGAPACGAVALPALAVTYSTASPPTPVADSLPASPRIIVSRTRPPAIAADLADRLGGVLVEMGSAGAKAMAIVRGEADIYVHAGGQYQWDSCAPAAVALAAGLHCSRLDGSPMRYGQRDPFLPDLLICTASVYERVRDALDAAV